MNFLAAGAMVAVYSFEVRFLTPVLPALLFFAAAFIVVNEPKFFRTTTVKIFPAMATGLLFGGFGTVSVSAFYMVESFAAKGHEIYPSPWLTSILLLLALFFFCRQSDDILFRTRAAFAYVGLLSIGMVSLMAPGIVFALAVAVVGAIFFEVLWLWLGLLFGAVFTVLYVYGGTLSLLNKSYVLIGLGVTLLVVRKLLTYKKMAET